MTAFTNFVLGTMASLAGIILLCVAVSSIKLLSRAASALWDALCEARWKYCIGHSALGFVVAILVAPSLPIPLAMAAGVVSAAIVSLLMQKLENFELSRPVPTPAPARVQARRR